MLFNLQYLKASAIRAKTKINLFTSPGVYSKQSSTSNWQVNHRLCCAIILKSGVHTYLYHFSEQKYWLG